MAELLKLEFPKADLSSTQIESITAIKPDPENGVLTLIQSLSFKRVFRTT